MARNTHSTHGYVNSHHGDRQCVYCITLGRHNVCFRSYAFIIIILYIYHALINALSAHMIQINRNIIFYTHVEHSPTETIYIKYYKKEKEKKVKK